MAELLALPSAIASLVTLVGQVSKLSYDFFSDVRNATKSQKMFLQEISALTQVFLQMEDAFDMQPSVALRPSSQLRSTLADSQDLLSQLKHSLTKATEGESAFSRIKSSMRWPFNEKEVKSTVERLRRHRCLPCVHFKIRLLADDYSRDILVTVLASDTL